MSSYFASFTNFVPSTGTPVEQDFRRLAKLCRWKPNTKKYQTEWRRCLLSEFDTHIGTMVADNMLGSWQAFCIEIGIDRVPTTITQCKKALKAVNVNLVDLINSRRTCTQVNRFPSHQTLVHYTIRTRKIFPKHQAKKDGVLKILLKEIFTED